MSAITSPFQQLGGALFGGTQQNAFQGQAASIGTATQQDINARQGGYDNANAQTAWARALYQANMMNIPVSQTAAYQSLNPQQQQQMSSQFQGNGQQTFTQSPGYQFQLQQGNKGINQSAAAQGGLLSGATLQALGQYNQGVANQSYNQYLQNLGGFGAIQQNATMANQLGANIGQTTYAGLTNQATSQYNANTAESNAINSWVKQAAGMSAASMGSGGGGGGSSGNGGMPADYQLNTGMPTSGGSSMGLGQYGGGSPSGFGGGFQGGFNPSAGGSFNGAGLGDVPKIEAF